MKFNAFTLKLSAEQFFLYTNKIDVGIKSKSKSYDLWAKILSGRPYSPLSSKLSSNTKEIEYEFNTEIIIALFHEKGRVIDRDQAIKIFANSISECLPYISEQFSKLVRLIKQGKSYSVMSVHPDGLGLIEEEKPGYVEIKGFSFSDHKRASDFEGLVLELAEQTLIQHLNIFAAMRRSSDKFGNQKFKDFLKSNKNFPEFISKQLFKETTLDDQYIEVESNVADAVDDYFRKVGIEYGDFLSVDTSMVNDFIESVAGSAMSCIESYRTSDDEELVLGADSFEFIIKQKIEFYTGS